MNNDAAPDSRLVLDFIDPLFAIAVHISLAEGVMKTSMYERWIHIGHLNREVWLSANLFDFGVLLLGYAIVLTSWFGYHRSVGKKPILLATVAGQVRFIVDVLLLLDYCLILTRFADFTFVLGAICFAFLLFVIWDQAKRLEYTEDVASARRRGVSVLWFIMFLLLLLSDWLLATRSLTILVLGIVFSFLYRWHKEHPRLIWEKAFCAPFPYELRCAP